MPKSTHARKGRVRRRVRIGKPELQCAACGHKLDGEGGCVSPGCPGTILLAVRRVSGLWPGCGTPA
jgi:hypothetical protein